MFTKNFKLIVLSAIFAVLFLLPALTQAQFTQMWAYRYSGIGNDGVSYNATKIDAAGNLYVAGWSVNPNTGYDILVMKFIAGSTGYPFWVTTYNGIGGTGIDEAGALTIDNSGNIYVTGSSWGGGSDRDVITLKYNNNGVLQWVQRYNGAFNGPDWANCITLDASGNVFVAGRTETSGSGTHGDYLTIKYSNSGVMQWARTFDGTSDNNDDDVINSIAADASGNVMVTGKAGWSGSGYDIVNIKYTASGVGTATHYDGSKNDDDEGIKVVSDPAGNYYVTGSTQETGLGISIMTFKISATGNLLWTKHYDYFDDMFDIPSDMKVDGSGVYITGSSGANGTGVDYITIKYSTAGTQLWAARLNGPGNSYDQAQSLATDINANVYVTGKSIGNGSLYDIATVKYSSSGVQLGNVRMYNGPNNLRDYGNTIEVNNTGSVIYVIGNSEQSSVNSDIVTIKYSQPVGIENSNSEIPDKFSLEQNYPNPFNPSTTIGFSLKTESNVSIKVYDIQGKEVANPVEEKLSAGSYEFKFDASKLSSGTYFYKMITSDFTDIKKMVLIK